MKESYVLHATRSSVEKITQKMIKVIEDFPPCLVFSLSYLKMNILGTVSNFSFNKTFMYVPPENRKSGLLMFLGVIERNQWREID